MQDRASELRRTLPPETVRKGVRATLRAWMWPGYTEGQMERKAPVWLPAGLRCKCVRGFSDSFSKTFVNKGKKG